MKLGNFLKAIGSVLLMIGGNALAATNCNNALTPDMTQCATENFKQLDTQLNQTYIEYQARLNASQKKQLKETQLAWIKFRDLACDFESSGVEGGSAFSMVRYDCLATKTEMRLKEIKKLASCEEGDLSCPAWK